MKLRENKRKLGLVILIIMFFSLFWFNVPTARAQEKADFLDDPKEVSEKLQHELREKTKPIRLPFILSQGKITDELVEIYTRTFGDSFYVTNDGKQAYYLHRFEKKAHDKAENILLKQETGDIMLQPLSTSPQDFTPMLPAACPVLIITLAGWWVSLTAM